MIEMTLPAITCGHCASTVTQTCKLVDPQAKVDIDINTKTVRIESAGDRAEFAEALLEAGYPPA